MLMRSLNCPSLKPLDESQAYDSQLWDDEWDDFEPEGKIPSVLIREFSEQETSCDDATDEAASLFEVDRLTSMGVKEGINGPLEDLVDAFRQDLES